MKKKAINTISCEDTFGSVKESGMETQQLFDTLESQLRSHDWFYEYSDDNRYYKTGQREFAQIWNTMQAIQEIGEAQFDQALDLFKEYKPVVSTCKEKIITN